MEENLLLIHRRNLILYRLIVGYTILNILFGVLVPQFSAVIPFYWASFFIVAAFLLWKKKLIRFTMWSFVFVIFSYSYFLLSVEPNLFSLIFIWVCLMVSAIYQNLRIIIFTGILSLLLTIYAFYQFRHDIFSTSNLLEFMTIVVFGIFITFFLFFFTRFVSQLYKEAKLSKEKVNFILDSSNVVTFSYNTDNEEVLVTTGRDILPQLPTKYRSKSAVIWMHYAHSEDVSKLQSLDEQLLLGKTVSVEYRLVFMKNKVTWVQCQLIPILEGNSIQRIEGILIDITEKKLREQEINYLAYHDQLTGLPNRSKLQSEFTDLFTARNSPKLDSVFLVFIDLDEFKKINDSYGHLIGDQLLKLVAKRLKNCIREDQIISRLSGDEFVAVISGVSDDDISKIAARIKTTLSVPYTIENYEIKITTSIGIYKYSNEADDLNEMLKRADQAMYQVKRRGKNDFCMYEPGMSI